MSTYDEWTKELARQRAHQAHLESRHGSGRSIVQFVYWSRQLDVLRTPGPMQPDRVDMRHASPLQRASLNEGHDLDGAEVLLVDGRRRVYLVRYPQRHDNGSSRVRVRGVNDLDGG
jgi:hypothetical protein